MADYCAPLAECTGLDSRLLINRTVYGPALALELAEIPFGPVRLDGASLHSSVTWSYEQTWSTREACCGRVRSVLGLAPAETVTTCVLPDLPTPVTSGHCSTLQERRRFDASTTNALITFIYRSR